MHILKEVRHAETIKIFLLLFADDMVVISGTESGVQTGLHILCNLYKASKLVMDAHKRKILVLKR